MAQSKSAGASANWTSIQAYVLATICLVVGIAVGYLLRGSAAGDAKPQPSVAPAAASAAMPATNSQPTPEQLKHMADTQAQPILAQLSGSPNDPKLLAQAGNVYYDAQQYRDAVDYYGRALRADPNDANIRTDMGTAYFYLGDSDRALQEFQTALKSDPKHGQTMFNMGMVLWQGKGDVSGAVAAWEKLLKTVPDYPDRARVEEMLAKAKQHANIKPGTKTSKPASM
jgi:cytochrome c-type biogenesis protein CcmH/NrfG